MSLNVEIMFGRHIQESSTGFGPKTSFVLSLGVQIGGQLTQNVLTFIRLGPIAATVSTLKSRTAVPFHTPTVPFWTTISEANMKPQSRDSYQPRESGVHSNK